MNNESNSIDKKSTKLPIVTGILLVISSATILYSSLLFIVLLLNDIDVELYGMEITIYFLFIGVISIIFGIFTLLGGIMSIKKKSWGLAIAGSILGVISGILIFWVASILSLISLILIAVSKEEFD